jgi:hypothetical protein
MKVCPGRGGEGWTKGRAELDDDTEGFEVGDGPLDAIVGEAANGPDETIQDQADSGSRSTCRTGVRLGGAQKRLALDDEGVGERRIGQTGGTITGGGRIRVIVGVVVRVLFPKFRE